MHAKGNPAGQGEEYARDWSERPDDLDDDCLSSICPQCGGVYAHPDCSCGYVHGDELETDDEPQTREELLRAYLDAGFALTPLAEGQKRPKYPNWQKEPSAIRAPEQLGAIRHGVGLLHRWSTPLTCTLDVDDYSRATAWLAERGIDLPALLAADDAVQIRSGRPNRAKLLYRLPEGTDAPVTETVKDAAGNMVLEFRCANSQGESVQDVLPPSINPDSGMEYTWAGAGSWRRLPVIPESLLTAWETLRAAYRQGAERPESSYSNTTTVPNETAADLRSALLAMRADDHDLWIRMGLALHELGDQGRALWLEWSATSMKFEPSEAARRWDTFEPNRTGYEAVFAEAQRRGWVNTRSRANPRQRARASVKEQAQRAFRLLTHDELASLPPLRWRVKGVLPAAGLGALWGPPGSGKTFLALDLAGAIATGRPLWFGNRVNRAPVVYAALEGEAGIQTRIAAYRVQHGDAGLENMRFIVEPFSLLSENDRPALIEAIQAVDFENPVVILDTLNRATPGTDENSAADMGLIVDAAKELQTCLGGLVLLIHHAGKDTGKGMRGHSSLPAALDAVIAVRREGETRRWTTRQAEGGKVKDGSDDTERTFTLQIIELGEDDDGDAITSCIVVDSEHSGARTKAKPLSGDTRACLESLVAAMHAHGTPTPPGIIPDDIQPQPTKIVLFDAWKQWFFDRHKSTATPGARRTALSKAISELKSRNAFREFAGFVWPTPHRADEAAHGCMTAAEIAQHQ